MKSSCSIPAGAGKTIAFRADREVYKLVIAQDSGACMAASLEPEAAKMLAETITRALAGPGVFSLET